MKKTLLVFVLVCLLFSLAGCGCKHEETKLINSKEATCTSDGYTGDTICAKCSEVVVQGQVITSKGHIFSELMGAKEATCTKEGYTGDIYCTVCTENVKPGEIIPMAEHTQSERLNGYDPTCRWVGYTGNIYCTVCSKLLEEGEEIPTLPHTPAEERSSVREPSCERDGYTGNICCTECGETVEEGEAIPMTGHTADEPYNPSEPTCIWDGYTGTIYCSVCGDWMQDGEKIPALGHTAGEPVDGYEPTCTSEGYTGTIYCSVCGNWMESGQSIPVIEHTLGDPLNFSEATCLADGYTGDRVCAACNQTFSGEVIPKLDHVFDENNACTTCEWMVPGLYIDDTLQFTWDQMVANNYVTIDTNRNRLTGVQKSLYGRLVVAEGLLIETDQVFQGCALNSIFLPPSVNYVRWGMFADNPSLEEVRFFGPIYHIDDWAFSGCIAMKNLDIPYGLDYIDYHAFNSCLALESLELPETLTGIGEAAFYGCTSLREINLPASLKRIEAYAFDGCSSLNTLELPEGLEYMGTNFVSHSGVAALVTPSTLTGMGSLQETSLKVLDMSKSLIVEWGDNGFRDSTGLETLIPSATLTKMADSLLINCSKLKRLILPEGFTTLYDGWAGDFSTCESLNTVVWPVTLADGSLLASAPNLKNILYTGSQLQWDLTISKDLFTDKTIIFDYVPES